MSPQDMPEFGSALAGLFASKGRRTTGAAWDDVLAAYFRTLGKFPMPAVRQAIRIAEDSDEPLPIAGKLRVMVAGLMAHDDSERKGCDTCNTGEEGQIAGMVRVQVESPLRNGVMIDWWENCRCPLGKARDEGDRQRKLQKGSE